MAQIQEFVEQIKGMTVLELNELVKALETEFGVSAAAAAMPVAAVAAAGAAAAEVEEKTEFLGTTKVFFREHLDIKKLQKKDDFEDRSDRLLKKFTVRLRDLATPEAEGLLEDFFRNHLIDIEELTPELKNKILLERLTDKFLNYTQNFFQQLDQAKEQQTFLTLAQTFVNIIPEMIRRDRYSEILCILQSLQFHFHQKTMWGLLASQVLEEIGQGEIPALLEGKFLEGKKEVRAAIIPIFAALEIGAIPPLPRGGCGCRELYQLRGCEEAAGKAWPSSRIARRRGQCIGGNESAPVMGSGSFIS